MHMLRSSFNDSNGSNSIRQVVTANFKRFTAPPSSYIVPRAGEQHVQHLLTLTKTGSDYASCGDVRDAKLSVHQSNGYHSHSQHPFTGGEIYASAWQIAATSTVCEFVSSTRLS
jgi:hypothetical protein